MSRANRRAHLQPDFREWATQDQMASMFGVDRTSISKHLTKIYEEGELIESATCEETSQVRPETKKPVRPPVAIVSGSDEIPEVSDADCAFQGRWRELLPKWEDLTKDEKHYRGPFCEAVSSLFFSGGKLTDHGITFKPGVDGTKVMRYIRATLGDFGPSHEHKIGGIAHMLAKWCHINPSQKGRKAP